MEQLQNIDLILSIAVKAVFIFLTIAILFLIYKLIKAISYLQNKVEAINLNFQSTTNHIKNEITLDNFANAFKGLIEIYILDNFRKTIFSAIKKAL